MNDNNYTIGIEEEYMICDPDTGELIDCANQIMDLIPKHLKERFSYELLLSEIESNTSISSSVDEAVDKLVLNRNLLRDIGGELGYKIGISGTHPTADPANQVFVNNDSYKWVSSQLKYYAKQNITFALHVHIGLNDMHKAIHINNGLRRWVAPLLSLSCNSPFFNNKETGFLSSRTMQFGLFPRTGFADTITSYNNFLELINILKDNKSIIKTRHLWWKLRPHTDFKTIEFRMCDAQRSLKNIKMLASLAQALTFVASNELDEGILIEDYNMDLLEDSLWKAARFGFDSMLYDQINNCQISMKDYIYSMYEYALPGLRHFDNNNIINTIDLIIKNGTEGDMQQKYYNDNAKDINKLKYYLIDNVKYVD